MKMVFKMVRNTHLAIIKRIAFAILLGLSVNAFACNSDSVVWNDILECYMNDEKEQERKFNQVYQETLKRLPIAKKVALKKSQRAWLIKMENECAEFNNQSLYGREGAFDVIRCRINAMEQRVVFLINYR